MGGRGATSYKSVTNMTREELIKDLVKNYGEYTRGDLQGVVEAYAMVHNLSFLEGDKILQEIDRKYDERIKENQPTKSDKELMPMWKRRAERNGATNVVTSIKDGFEYTEGTIYRQGFRDTSFRISRKGGIMMLDKYSLGESKPERLATGVENINNYMVKHGLVYSLNK